MQRMFSTLRRSTQRTAQLPLPGMLHPALAQGPAQPQPPGGDACRDCAHAQGAWPGRDLGVRAPMPGETTLTWAEVHHGMREGPL